MGEIQQFMEKLDMDPLTTLMITGTWKCLETVSSYLHDVRGERCDMTGRFIGFFFVTCSKKLESYIWTVVEADFVY